MRNLLVPPILVPALLAIGIVAYALLRPPLPAPGANPIALESVSPSPASPAAK